MGGRKAREDLFSVSEACGAHGERAGLLDCKSEGADQRSALGFTSNAFLESTRIVRPASVSTT